MSLDPTQFLGLPACDLKQADAVILPLPLEATVTYGTGTWRAPRAILEASRQVELFDEETLVDFSTAPRIHTLPPLQPLGSVEDYLAQTARRAAAGRGKFLLALGGEHLISYGVLDALADPLGELTVVHVDAHADLADQLEGRRWSHGTVMRRLWERGCRLVQIGIRSLSRAEHELIGRGQRITTYYAHQLPQSWPDVLATLRGLAGPVYLSIDVDGLDPAVFPSTGTPQPGGLSWRQTMEIIRAVAVESSARLIGGDVVELVAAPHGPGCDLSAARLAAKLLAWWDLGRRAGG
jgi:agmatinase